jgi:hypothetical protein
MAQHEADKTRKHIVAPIRAAFPTAFVWKVNERMRSGVPDVLAVVDGRHVWFEAKDLRQPFTPERLWKAVTDIQKRTIGTLEDAGARVYLVAFVPGGGYHVCRPDHIVSRGGVGCWETSDTTVVDAVHNYLSDTRN